MGSLSGTLSSLQTWATSPSPFSSVPNWLFWGGGALAAWMVFMPGGTEYRQQARALRSRYRGYRRFGGALSQDKGAQDKGVHSYVRQRAHHR